MHYFASSDENWTFDIVNLDVIFLFHLNSYDK